VETHLLQVQHKEKMVAHKLVVLIVRHQVEVVVEQLLSVLMQVAG
tara:strand:+ start:192 stop:326 length:135 start_codon:yes stop_codon:yes gene_type:complete